MHTTSSIRLLLLSLAFTAIPHQADARQRLHQYAQPRAEAVGIAHLPAGTRIERDIAYGPDPQQRYDVYRPATQAATPILVMVHGGGWHNGDKGNSGVVGNKARYWLQKGYAFVSVNYRLLPAADPLQQARDVAAAVASVQKHAPQWGADPHKLVLMGHSAGAHLVTLLGASPTLLTQAGATRPLGVVSLDSAAMNVPEVMRLPRLPRLYPQAFGTDPAFWVSASPYDQLSRQSLPMLIVCSSQRIESCAQSRSLAAKARELGVAVQVLPEAMRHGEINHDLGAPSAYTRAVSDWIDRLID